VTRLVRPPVVLPTRTLTLRVSIEAYEQLRQMERHRSREALLFEALNLLFEKYGQSAIAAKVASRLS
jgi:hypothetical protein